MIIASDICKAIGKIEHLEDIRAISDALRFRHKQLQQNTAASFGVGARVEFNDRLGNVVTGRILKINQKTVQVRSDRTLVTWKVTPSLLRRAAA